MAEIIVVWILALIVIAIGWGVIDRITIPLKALAQLPQTPKRTQRFEIVIASLLALAVISIMVAAADGMEKMADLPSLLIWAGGLWLIPYRFDAIGHYWLSVFAIAAILVLFRMGSTSRPATSTHAQTDVSTQQGQDISQQEQDDTSAGVNGLGFLFWIVLIGLTVAAIAGYTSTSNAVALHP